MWAIVHMKKSKEKQWRKSGKGQIILQVSNSAVATQKNSGFKAVFLLWHTLGPRGFDSLYSSLQTSKHEETTSLAPWGNAQPQTSLSIGQCCSFERSFFPSSERISRQDSSRWLQLLPLQLSLQSPEILWVEAQKQDPAGISTRGPCSVSFQLRLVWGGIIIHYFKDLHRTSGLLSTFSSPLSFDLHTSSWVALEVGIFISLLRNRSFREGTWFSQGNSLCTGSSWLNPKPTVPVLPLFHLFHHSANQLVISWEH